MDSKDFRHKSQCPTCQVLYPQVGLAERNSISIQGLGDNWDEERGWQCAEADLCAQHIAYGL
jgi:hypothetical protein